MAGLSAAITLRQCRYGGRIILISGEDIYPYDRTVLTKLVTFADARKFTLRSEELLKKHGIEVQLSTRVESVNSGKNELVLEGGKTESYDKLLLATGLSAITIPNLRGYENVYVIRDHKDQEKVKE